MNYTLQIVLLGVCVLGLTSGVVGVFVILRKRALVGDVVGHAALPGIACAFLVLEWMYPGSGKSVWGLTIGAALAGLLGAACTVAIDRTTRIRSDAALAITLSLFYGLGAALLSVVQRIPAANSAGLKDYLNGKAATLTAGDVQAFLWMSGAILAVCLVAFKEFTLLCFDDEYAKSLGLKTLLFDALLMAMVVLVTLIGMQTVGLILVVATLIIPAAAARFWTDDVRLMTLISGLFGSLCSGTGVLASSLYRRVAAGPTVVLLAGLVFAISLAFGTRRGVLPGWWKHRRMRRQIAHDDVLRGLFETAEPLVGQSAPPEKWLALELPSVDVEARKLTQKQQLREIEELVRAGLARELRPGVLQFTESGLKEARRATRQHRLWEHYLMHYAEIRASHVDRDADEMEHLLASDNVDELAELLEPWLGKVDLPPSPHALGKTLEEPSS